MRAQVLPGTSHLGTKLILFSHLLCMAVLEKYNLVKKKKERKGTVKGAQEFKFQIDIEDSDLKKTSKYLLLRSRKRI